MSLTSKSPYHIIYRAIVKGKLDLIMSADILLEYEEIIQQKYGGAASTALISLLKELPTVYYFTRITNEI